MKVAMTILMTVLPCPMAVLSWAPTASFAEDESSGEAGTGDARSFLVERRGGSIRLMSHLACADIPDNPTNDAQLAVFQALPERGDHEGRTDEADEEHRRGEAAAGHPQIGTDRAQTSPCRREDGDRTLRVAPVAGGGTHRLGDVVLRVDRCLATCGSAEISNA